jgi:hypothetical protein
MACARGVCRAGPHCSFSHQRAAAHPRLLLQRCGVLLLGVSPRVLGVVACGLVPLLAFFATHNRSQACNLQPCDFNFTVGPWSECSKYCGPGVQYRSVRCVDSFGRDVGLVSAWAWACSWACACALACNYSCVVCEYTLPPRVCVAVLSICASCRLRLCRFLLLCD